MRVTWIDVLSCDGNEAAGQHVIDISNSFALFVFVDGVNEANVKVIVLILYTWVGPRTARQADMSSRALAVVCGAYVMQG